MWYNNAFKVSLKTDTFGTFKRAYLLPWVSLKKHVCGAFFRYIIEKIKKKKKKKIPPPLLGSLWQDLVQNNSVQQAEGTFMSYLSVLFVVAV